MRSSTKFSIKKRIVNTLVHRVTINASRELSVEIRLNLFQIIEEASDPAAVHCGKF